jgi:alkaline phosphatase
MNFRSKLLISISSLWVFVICGCAPKQHIVVEYQAIDEKPKNIIFMIGDGMGLAHITAHLYQNKGSVFTEFKNIGLVQTHAADNVITDSGAGATAFSTGNKAPIHGVGIDEFGNKQPNIMELAQKQGFKTGIVTTASILDATPAAFYAHQKNRYWEDSVSRDLLNSNLDFIIGAGTKYFNGSMEGSPFSFRHIERQGFLLGDIMDSPIREIPVKTNKRIMFFNGVETALIRSLGVDHLKKASSKAIQYLSSKEQPYILMIEGAQIDWASHAGNTDEFFYRMKGFEMAIKEVLDYVRKDKNTLLVITADHATGGLSIREGTKMGNVNLDFSTNGHTGTMVPIFAYGPGAEQFRGVMQNTDIFFKFCELLNIPVRTTNVN